MAVAVKNTPDVTSSSLFDRPSVVSLTGVVYILGSLGILFKGIPALWWAFWDALGLGGTSFVGPSLLGLILIVAAVGLIVLGSRLLGPRAAPGTRAGIFVGLLGVLIILLLTRWASLWLEHWVYDVNWFSPTVGAVLTGAVFLVLLVVGAYYFMKPACERAMARFEAQGWFSATPYKANQGVRVRRGTVFGLLILAASGIYSLMNHNTLKGNPSWMLNIPFTGRVVVTNPADATPWLPPANAEGQIVVERYALQNIVHEHLDPSRFVKVTITGNSKFEAGQIVARSEFEAAVAELKKEDLTPPQAVSPALPGGPTTYATLTLLPSLQFTVPLLLAAFSLWISWRIVSMPTFADFLIATEAELNKVSWTTRRRLVQDTVVVLITVFLMAVYLFAMDQAWRMILSVKPVGVLQIPQDQEQTNQSVEQKKW
jgi:preprotein translocase SecE subunit